MRPQIIKSKTSISVNESTERETLEQMLARVTQTNEPIDGISSPINFTEKKDGVRPEYNIRTDKYVVALEAMDKIARSKIAKNDGTGEAKEPIKNPESRESTQGTNE